MSTLNKKNGNLRGVKLSYHLNDDDWAFGVPVQGWVVSGKNGHKFLLSTEVDGKEIEIVLTQEALDNISDAVAEADAPIPPIFDGNYFPSAWFGSPQWSYTDTTGI
jgi:hypothetical protein